MMKQAITAGLMLTALAACGERDGVRKFSNVERDAFQTFSNVSALGISNAASLPAAGSALYQGRLGIGGGSNALIGNLQLTADFGANTIGGTARNFIDTGNVQYSGGLTITNGGISRTADPLTEHQFTADVNGVISSESTNT